MADKYVTKAGNDSTGDGSLGNPWLTITKGVNSISSGDRLNVGNGTYTETLIDGYGVTFPSGIDDANHTIIRAINNRMVILDGGSPGTPSTGGHVIGVVNKQFITFDGLEIDGTNAYWGCVSIGDNPETHAGSGSSFIVFKNGAASICEYGFGGGVQYSGTVENHHISILDNEIHHTGNTPTGFFQPHAIYPPWRDSLVEGNDLHDNANATDGGAVVHQYADGNGGHHRNIYRKNFIHDNYGAAFSIRDGDDCEVSNNIMARNGSAGGGCGGVVFGSYSRLTIAFNTIVNNTGGAYCALGGVDWTITNDIANGNTIDGVNNFGYEGPTIVTLYTATPTLVDSSSLDPQDYRPQSGSGVIETGVDGTGISDDFDDNVRPSPPSYGAFEFETAAPITGVPPTDTLDYGSGTITGKNGGTGWLAAWSQTGSAPVTIETEPSGAQGGFAAKLITAGAGTYGLASRQFEPTNDGIFYFLVRTNNAAPTKTQAIDLATSGVDALLVRLGPSGSIDALDDGVWTATGETYVADTWYELAIELDESGHPGDYRVIVDGGMPSPWYGMNGKTFVDYVKLYNEQDDDTTIFWVSAIGYQLPDAPSAGSVQQLILKKILKDEDFDLGTAQVSLHDGAPGLTGAHEISGGSYTRQAVSAWDAASDGEIANTNAISWTGVPLKTVTHAGLWSEDGTIFISGVSLDAPKTITSGTARFSAGTLQFSVGANFSTYLANKLLDYILRGVNFTTANVWGAIHTGTLDTAGGGEESGGSYARQELDAADWADDGMSAEGDSVFQLPFEAAVTWNDVTSGVTGRVGFWDAATNGNFLMWGPDLTLPGTDITVDASALIAELDQTP